MMRRWCLGLALLTVACGGEEPVDPPTGGTGGNGGGGGQGGSGYVSEAGAMLDCPDGGWLDAGGACLPPGVQADGCGEGFSFEDGACFAVLPDTPCGPGTFAIPGETSCHGFDACGSGTFGDIPTDVGTQHVNATFGGASDGSAGAPWTTIQQAVNAAADGAVVAVAAGTYAEAVTIDHPVALWGVCGDEVTIDGGDSPALSIVGATGVEVRGVALTGQTGATLDNAPDATFEDVWIHDTTEQGLGVNQGSGVVVTASLIENANGYGIAAPIGEVEVVQSSIRDIGPTPAGDWGNGLLAWGSFADTQRIVFRQSLIERCRSFGIAVQAVTDTVVEDTLVRDVDVSASIGGDGMGLWQLWTDGDGERASLTVQRSVFERLHSSGIAVWGGDALIEDTTVRDVAPQMTAGEWGAGIRLFSNGEGTGAAPTGIVRRSTVDRGHRVGVELWAAEGELEQILVRDPGPKTDGAHGFGIIAFVHDATLETSQLTIRGGRIERARQGALVISGSTATIDSLAVLDTQPTGTGSLGVAVSVLTEWMTGVAASAEMSQLVVDGTHAGGIVVGGGDLTVSDVVVRNVKKQVDVDDFGDGIGASSTIVWIPDVLPTTLDVTRATISGVPRAGISNFGAEVSVSDTFLDCNAIDLDGENLDVDFVFTDAGGNDCGCGDERTECKVLTTDIEPPFGF
ncbi:MAG: right-handed parallel beta-helix repeat-containing protein [Polyangiaceae bacterium]